MTRPDPIHLTLTASPVDAVEHGPRQVAGVVVLYGADPASTSSGAVVFEPGSLTWSDDLTRVKLLLDHDHTQPVGYATASVEDDDGVAMAFTLVDHPRADAAFDEVLLGLRDGFSVGATATEYSWDDYDVLHIHAGTIREVTLCAIPALDDARVTDIRATHHEETPMTRSTRPVPAALQATTPTVHRHGVNLTPPAPSSRTPRRTSAPDSAPSAPDSAPSAPDSAPSAPDSAPSAPASAPSAPQHEEAAGARLVHASAPVAAPTGPRRVTLAQAARIVSDVVRRGGTASDVRAALADITPTSLPGTGGADMENPWLRDTFLGELWTASKSERPWIDLLGAPRDITGLKVYGWRWETRPRVGDYAGDKAEIPTNSPKIVPAEAPVTRTAGGWDIDRIFVDLGDASLIEALWTAAVEDYRAKTEAKASAALLAAATALPASGSLPSALVALGSAASAIGAAISGVGVAGDVWSGLAALTRDEVPWWLGGGDSISLGTTSGSIGSTRFWVNPALAAGTVLAADSRAATWYEKTPPVRVNAVDLAHGGVDLGLFGYHGIIVNDARAILRTTVTATP